MYISLTIYMFLGMVHSGAELLDLYLWEDVYVPFDRVVFIPLFYIQLHRKMNKREGTWTLQTSLTPRIPGNIESFLLFFSSLFTNSNHPATCPFVTMLQAKVQWKVFGFCLSRFKLRYCGRETLKKNVDNLSKNNRILSFFFNWDVGKADRWII